MSDTEDLTLNHEAPDPSAVDIDREAAVSAMSAGPGEPLLLPTAPKVGKSKRVLLVPTMRFDSVTDPSPWYTAEPNIWDLLVNGSVEHVEDRILDGRNGTLWGRMRKHDGGLVSVYLRVDGLRNDSYKMWKAEYALDQSVASLSARESVAYEVSKATGMEDMVPPLAVREIPMDEILSETAKDSLAQNMKIARTDVASMAGNIAVLQLVPPNSSIFSSKWVSLGDTNELRWKSASDSLRHSIYRIMALNFLLGTADSPLSGLGYNLDTDRCIVSDLSLSFPHPGFSAEKYMRQRAKGWGRNDAPGASATEGGPAHAMDVSRMTAGMSATNKTECIQTFQQVSGSLTDDSMSLLSNMMAESGLPVQCRAGFFARVAYLRDNPTDAMEDPVLFVRNVLAPTRRGFGLGANEATVNYAIQMVGSTGEQIDFVGICQEPLEDESLKLI